jgi:branched-chain amino acid transport system substrate-binding protein
LLTGDLDYRSAEEGHMPDKAAVMIELKGGKPSFLGWRRPESVPAP